MSLADDVAALASLGGAEGAYSRPRPTHPAGFEPGVRWDGAAGELSTGPLATAPTCWDDLLTEWGLDPADVEVVEPVERRSWDAAVGAGEVRRMNYFKAKVRRRARGSQVDVDELVREIKRHKPAKAVPTGDRALVVCLTDWQLGKPDGDGTAGTVARVLASIDAVTARAKELRRTGRSLGSLYVVGLGDLIEGCEGHYAMQSFGVELNLVEQVRVVRRLLVKALSAWAPLFEQVVVACVPGNHGENRKDGKAYTDWSDNHDVAVFEQAAAVLEANPDVYGHVSFVFPRRADLTVTLDVAGTTVALAHGHQFRAGKAMDWWAKQAHGMQPAGDATLLLAGHLHHLHVEQGGAKTFMQAPALDGGSDWWRHTTGQDAPPAVLSLVVGGGGWSDMALL